jgi:hypothetical protein
VFGKNSDEYDTLRRVSWFQSWASNLNSHLDEQVEFTLGQVSWIHTKCSKFNSQLVK